MHNSSGLPLLLLFLFGDLALALFVDTVSVTRYLVFLLERSSGPGTKTWSPPRVVSILCHPRAEEHEGTHQALRAELQVGHVGKTHPLICLIDETH